MGTWLDSIDLAEYTAALRGSGINCALIILEPRFSAETLADYLLIPKNKNLLRKHLKIKFQELLSKNQQLMKNQVLKSDIILPKTKFKPKKARYFLLPQFHDGQRIYYPCSLDLCCPWKIVGGATKANEVASPVSEATVEKNQLNNNNNRKSRCLNDDRQDLSGVVMGGMASMNIR